MRIVLVNPPDDLEEMLGEGKVFVQKYEPLGLLSIAAVAREKGCDVHVVDAFAEELSHSRLQARIQELKPDIVGITTLTCSGAAVFALGQWIKQTMPQAVVVLGNVHAAAFAREYLENGCADAVVNGEGEYAFLHIIEQVRKKRPLAGIRGVSCRGVSGEVFVSRDHCFIEDLDRLPPPARDLVPRDRYNLGPISNQLFVGGKGTVVRTMVTSRGCPNRCRFCAVNHQNPQRFISVTKVADEMEFLVKEYGVSYVYFEDSLFIADKARVMDLCREIRKREIPAQWGVQGHVNYITPDIVNAMADAGCYDMALGIESGVQRLLDTVDKNIRLERVIDEVAVIKKHSPILVEGLFILGLPGETYADSLETIRFARSLDIDMAQFSILVPYPGSPLFEELRSRGAVDTGVREDGRVDTSAWKRYSAYVAFSGQKPIWTTPGLTADQLIRLQKKAQRDFYLRPSMIRKNLRRITLRNIPQVLKILAKGFY
ncbi:MAG: B12-binding domain-containing radical SAM protein [Endomicrobiales bacterium]